MEYTNDIKEVFKEAIIKNFGEINNFGCCTQSGKWFSTESIFELICDTIDENDYLFLED